LPREPPRGTHPHSDRTETQAVTRRLTTLLDARNAEAQGGYMIRYSVGKIQYDLAEHASVNELLAAADAAIYRHKPASKARDVAPHGMPPGSAA
jgi:hypothetical protein